MQRVLDRERAHLGCAIVDGAAPRRLRVGEEIRRVAAEIVSLRAEVVIDHVEHHHQSMLMRGVDQGLQILGATVGAVGRVPQHAVIAPVAGAGEIRQRHQFKCSDAGFGEMIELVDDGAISPLQREGADMGFEDDRLMPWPPAPVGGAPWVGGMIDHFTRAEHVVRLKGGSGIGDVDLAVDAEFIARSGVRAFDFARKPAAIAARQCMRLVEQDVDAPGRGRP